MRTDLENTLTTIITAGWANESFGAVDEPGGHVALIVIYPNEVAEIADAFADDPITITAGMWIVTENELGQVTVETFTSSLWVHEVFWAREAIHATEMGEDR